MLNMMKHKGRSINKRVTIQQYPQQTSTKNFACQKRKKIAYCIFNFLFPLFLNRFQQNQQNQRWN
ncbi:hypothetical protein DXA83_20475 [Bacteroides thetaiotaomicron]|nr:hypothetical protein DXA83_20475 [Bacteroides thetaiotaomicron]